MKKYKEYMDGVTVSDTLHEKLKNLEAPKKQPQPWKKYGAMAAALVLVLGLGAWGLTRSSGLDAVLNNTELGQPEIGTTEHYGEPDIAVEPSPAPMPNSPGMETMGGYEVSDGETVAYYMLPYIEYGEVENEMAADIALPVGVTRRDLTEEELLALLGGETNIASHLNWNGYTLYAHAMVWPDDSLWLLCVSGIKGDTGYEHFTLEVAPDMLPPSCLVYEEAVVNNIWEREVRGESYDGDHASTRRVSFMDRGYGYRFEITGTDKEVITELVSRAVRWIIAGGGLTFEKPSDTAINSEANTLPYDPSASPTPTEEISTPAYDPNAD